MNSNRLYIRHFYTIYNNAYVGPRQQKRDLPHMTKIFKEGASKLTHEIKMYARSSPSNYMIDRLISVRTKDVVEDICVSLNKK